jgi:hypothetical protein
MLIESSLLFCVKLEMFLGLGLSLLLLLLVVTPTQLQPNYVLAQSTTTTTNQNGQQPRANQNTVADDNLRNVSSLSVVPYLYFDFPLFIPTYFLQVSGSLTTSSLLFGTVVSPSNSWNQINFTAAPLRDVEVQIIILNTTTGGEIINTTSVTTDSLGTFSVTIRMPSVFVLPIWAPPSSILVVGYFEGDENTFPTYEVQPASPPPLSPLRQIP